MRDAMDTLKFDKKSAREDYLTHFSELKYNKIRLGLFLLRNELLARNQLFVREWKELSAIDSDNNFESYQKKRNEFRKRWHVSFPNGTHFVKAVVNAVDADREEATVTLKIDLRYSKKRIMSELKAMVDKWSASYWERFESDVYWSDVDMNESELKEEIQNLKDLKAPRLLKGNVLKDFNDYQLYMKVWDLKNSGKSWRDIQETLKLNSIQAARNHCNAAKRLISQGIATLPPFPTK